ncbi:MAG: WS/DGAT domain-containing protein, partial [Pseudomonadota bacterium]
RVFGGECFDLAEVKAIKESEPGLKLNDVVLTICAGALHKYLKSGDMLPDDPLLSMVPVSVRSENAKKDLGNQVTVMSVPLGTHIADPDERITFQHDSQLSRKEMLDAVGAESLQDYSTLLPSALVGLASRVYTTYGIANRIAPIFNTVITNVPGPPIPIYNCGAKMERMYGLVPIFDGMGLGHVVNSYCDVLTISFNACAEMLPDPDFYSACLRESFEELLSVRAPRPKGRKPKVVHDADAKKAS